LRSTPKEAPASFRGRGLLCVAAVVGSLFLFLKIANPPFSDGQTVAIRNVQSGKYVTVSDLGVLSVSAESTATPGTRFKLVGLRKSTVDVLKPVKVQLRQTGKLGCQCSGATDEHGFGRFCHAWESEFHQPWCYVASTCQHGVRSKRHSTRKLQLCATEEGYLGPDGWKEAEGCPCSGHESVHGFGSYCRGWEFAGQTPWCYVGDTCESATGPNGGAWPRTP
jgi:hypothetical protein